MSIVERISPLRHTPPALPAFVWIFLGGMAGVQQKKAQERLSRQQGTTNQCRVPAAISESAAALPARPWFSMSDDATKKSPNVWGSCSACLAEAVSAQAESSGVHRVLSIARKSKSYKHTLSVSVLYYSHKSSYYLIVNLIVKK